jgi:uncharacterized protein
LITPIVVFAKAPHPGATKTRLIPAVGATGAALLHERLVLHTLVTAVAAGIGPVELCCSPTVTDPFFVSCARTHQVTLTEQGEGDLGKRMWRAATRTLAHQPSVVIIGCDCPVLAASHLQGAATVLAAGNDAVIAPAEDGGYVLIGLTRAHESLFLGIQWGGSDVMTATAARLDALGWRWQRLDPLWDVDRPADLARMRRELTHGEQLLRGLD